MAGIAIVLDILRTKPGFYTTQSLHSFGLFSAATAASTATASIAAGTPFASRALFGNATIPVAYCDAGAALSEDFICNIRSGSRKIIRHDSPILSTNEYYDIELKPMYSAFELKQLVITSLRSFLICYLPLLDAWLYKEEKDDVDLVVPFKQSLKQIIRETTVVTARRVLERLAIHYVSQRMAWKLLKDVPKSAMRKAVRGMPTSVYIFSISRTTCRGHFLGVAASWFVQVAIEIYRYIPRMINFKRDICYNIGEDEEECNTFLGTVSGITIRCGASLVFASIGAGIGATLLRPSVGQLAGCIAGDLAGPMIVSLCLKKVLHTDI